jgi:hypothetical protein
VTFGANPSAHADYPSQAGVFARFRVVGDSVAYSVEGMGDATVTADTGAGNFVLYRVTPFQFVENIVDGSFDASGTLPPGTYDGSYAS